MYFRVNYESQKYRIDLLKDYNMQFKKVSERLYTIETTELIITGIKAM